MEGYDLLLKFSNTSSCDVKEHAVEKFANKHLELLELEREAEIEENKRLQKNISVKNLKKKGVALPKLQIVLTFTGIFGRTVINFEPYWEKGPLPTHTITAGDIVGITTLNNDGSIDTITSGVVSKLTDTTISVAFDKNSNFTDLEKDEQYTIVKLANDITYKRMKRVLKILQGKGSGQHLVDVLFGEKEPSTCEESSFKSISFFNKNLNEEQKESVRFALMQKEVAIIHGPPGTGKSTATVECILQAISQKLKVLACAPSNVAVDSLVEKLAVHKIKMVRLGHPARFLPSIQQFSLDAIISCYDGSNVIDELHDEIDELRDKISKTKGYGNKKSLWEDYRCLLRDVKNREKFIVKQILKNCDIVLCTLTSGSFEGPLQYVDKDHFDICFIDECSQAIEAACWIPLLQTKKCVLAGDHNQLPPTIISKRAAKEGLELTLMERLLKLHGDGIKKMLTTQFRMNQVIMQWPSEKLYDNKLVAHESVRTHLLSDIPGIENNDDTTIPLLLIDTAGCNLHELQAEDEESKGNEGEADLVAIHINGLVKSGLNPADIAVITPYNLQVDLIKQRLTDKYPKLEIKSVDGFQGREKEAVVLSLVRSNNIGKVGFLAEDRRMNVAITRAKRHLAVICDSKTISQHEFLKSFLNYCEEKGEVRSAFQYENEIGSYPSIKQTILKSKSDSPKAKTSGSIKEEEKSNLKKKSTPKVQSSNNKVDVKNKTFKNLPSSEDGNTLKKIHSEEEKRITEEKYEEVLQKLVDSNEMSLTFPTSLSAFERRAVHEVAEKLGLIHISTGQETNRCIEVKKTIIDQPLICENVDTQPLDWDLESTSSTVKTPDVKMVVTDEKSTKNKKSFPKRKLSKNSAVKCNSKLKVLKLKETAEEDDFNDLIEQVVKADKTCRYTNCKKCVAVLPQVCQFCKGRFCFSHFIPETHGCGDAAKAHARSQIRKDGVLYSGSGRPEKKKDLVKHKYLQNKLDKKLKELSNKRKSQDKN